MASWNRPLLSDPGITNLLDPPVLASRWLGFRGANEEQLTQTEKRLRTQLPLSYREFLGFSNGWRNLTPFIWRLWPSERIDWFVVQNQQWIGAYTDPYPYPPPPPLPDERYFVYGEGQDPVNFRPHYLETALQISAEGDSAVMLLNPQVATAEGEWEAWFFANWLPGARRYRSFWEMMQEEYKSYMNMKE